MLAKHRAPFATLGGDDDAPQAGDWKVDEAVDQKVDEPTAEEVEDAAEEADEGVESPAPGDVTEKVAETPETTEMAQMAETAETQGDAEHASPAGKPQEFLLSDGEEDEHQFFPAAKDPFDSSGDEELDAGTLKSFFSEARDKDRTTCWKIINGLKEQLQRAEVALHEEASKRHALEKALSFVQEVREKDRTTCWKRVNGLKERLHRAEVDLYEHTSKAQAFEEELETLREVCNSSVFNLSTSEEEDEDKAVQHEEEQEKTNFTTAIQAFSLRLLTSLRKAEEEACIAKRVNQAFCRGFLALMREREDWIDPNVLNMRRQEEAQLKLAYSKAVARFTKDLIEEEETDLFFLFEEETEEVGCEAGPTLEQWASQFQ